ncbi:hypothetical protein GQ55_3G345400 [Panicum hallii var. hallii]|uniref:Uncharacterized protein n=1 Tax=Panicum hallii var. hallii TaxID=1504633 RepID=A0A2T7EFQ4_9POAL|nr:hypothetical protein GQ55_3G345400 [Panicum hallii var. hallii]
MLQTVDPPDHTDGRCSSSLDDGKRNAGSGRDERHSRCGCTASTQLRPKTGCAELMTARRRCRDEESQAWAARLVLAPGSVRIRLP